MRKPGIDSAGGPPEHARMSLVGSLIALSLLLLVGLGIAGIFLMGGASRDANDDDPDPRR
jgi:hypothetical protein